MSFVYVFVAACLLMLLQFASVDKLVLKNDMSTLQPMNFDMGLFRKTQDVACVRSNIA